RGAQAIHGEVHPVVAMAYSTLGLSCDLAGRYEAARENLEKSLDLSERMFGPDHTEVADDLHNLTTALNSLGRHQEALRASRRSVEIREKVLGRDHIDVATSLTNLAMTLEDLGRDDEALRAYSRSLAITVKAHGTDHVDVAEHLMPVAHMHLKRRDYATAWKLYERARVIEEKRGGAWIGEAYDGLARVRRAQKRYRDATRLLRRGIATHSTAPGSQLHHGKRMRILGEVYLDWRRPDRARVELERALAFWADAAGHKPVEAVIEERAEARFALARALWHRRGTRSRALAVARTARDELAGAGQPRAAQRADVESWLASRAQPAGVKRRGKPRMKRRHR
ncbi:MAG TPA: tetratricopeptide repeat protein, partial [Kofleriaceae bacterium]|nr:tetratricopeptide repeat protein [Kofleriaceae bacterium]